ncbi:MAG: ATP-binding cassette domain-containing protein [Ilumatobacteraceae bacterium]
MSLLEVRDLVIKFGNKTVVDHVSFDLEAGERLGIIGESGSGKTLTSLAVMGLLPDTATTTGSIQFEGREILSLSDREMSKVRGNRIGMIFQEPLTSLNPLMRVGKQIAQPLRNHRNMSLKDGLEKALTLCERVGLPDPERIVRAYPHQLSGGQRQRIGLAIALACNPVLLIADEPTTALDVTVQLEVLKLMNELVTQEGSSLIFVTHDLPVVSSMTEAVAVMQYGKMVEHTKVSDLFQHPRDDYSKKLIDTARATEAEFKRFSSGAPV